MSIPRGLQHITAQALVPEQLLHYVGAVASSSPRMFGPCVGHVYEKSVVLIAYPPTATEPESAACQADIDAALAAVQDSADVEHVTVLAPLRPTAAPPPTDSPANDIFWALPLPTPPPAQKLRNMLHRASRDMYITQDNQWTAAHSALADMYCRTRPLEAGTRHIFQHLGAYVQQTPTQGDVRIFSAYSPHNDALLACALGDYSAMGTAFYMFAFRQPHAPPGTSDALLQALCAEGAARGHSLLNLGLGINPGIAFFKQKWQARPWLSYTESAWSLRPRSQSWWSRLWS